jgi:hypothetical protein
MRTSFQNSPHLVPAGDPEHCHHLTRNRRAGLERPNSHVENDGDAGNGTISGEHFPSEGQLESLENESTILRRIINAI